MSSDNELFPRVKFNWTPDQYNGERLAADYCEHKPIRIDKSSTNSQSVRSIWSSGAVVTEIYTETGSTVHLRQ